jgi:HTH-type transcriptional regulator/antitoxin HigA
MRIHGKQIVAKGGFMPAFSAKKYGRLLADTLPRIVENQKEYDRLEEIANRLLTKGEDNLSPEEDQLLGLLTNLLEDYEARTLPPLAEISPAAALRFLMEENNLKQANLEDIFGSQSAVSRALNGSRRISIDHAKGLARRFKVSAELFI